MPDTRVEEGGGIDTWRYTLQRGGKVQELSTW